MKTITLDMLYALDACPKQRDLFAVTFGQSVTVTPDACAAVAHLFNWNWAAVHTLPAGLLADYQRQETRLWGEYAGQKTPLLAEYLRQKTPLLAEYLRQEALLWGEYQRQRAPLWAEYERQLATLLAEYQGQQARLFATLYNQAGVFISVPF